MVAPDMQHLLGTNQAPSNCSRGNGFLHLGKDIDPTAAQPAIDIEWKP